jgi:hypothetical protein
MSRRSVEEPNEPIFRSRQGKRDRFETTFHLYKSIPGIHSSQSFDGTTERLSVRYYCGKRQCHVSAVLSHASCCDHDISRCSITPTFQMSSVNYGKFQQLSNLDCIVNECGKSIKRMISIRYFWSIPLPSGLSNLSSKRWKSPPNHSILLVYSCRSILQAIFEAVRSLRTVSISVECSQCSCDSNGRCNDTHERALG